MNTTDTLRETYHAINHRSIPVAQTELIGPLTYCRALWALGEWIPTEAARALYLELNAMRDEGIVFDLTGNVSTGLLHWTLFQLETFPVTPHPTAKHLEDGETLQRILYEHPPVQLQFNGISKTRFGLFLCGYPSYDVTALRNQIRRRITDIREPHPQDICHSTLFRFTQEPQPVTRMLIDSLCERYAEVPLFEFKPTIWEYGFGTWLQQERHVLRQWLPAPRWILHRGLFAGPNRALENQEALLWDRLTEGWDIEIDIWRDTSGALWLGHDGPTTRLQNNSLLRHPRVWIHCKNLAALVSMPERAHYFVHDVDAATLTSRGFVWCYPGNQPGGGKDVVVLPERSGGCFPQLGNAYAVCSDYLPAYFLS